MPSPPCSPIAAARPAALAALRVVRTTKNPSRGELLGDGAADAPADADRQLAVVERLAVGQPGVAPSACHFEVAPITTATGLPLLVARPGHFDVPLQSNSVARRCFIWSAM